MNMDTGHIKLWRELSTDEKESGRWVKLGDDEYARAVTIEESERQKSLQDIFGPPKAFTGDDFVKLFGQKL